MNTTVSVTGRSKAKRAILPILVVLFVISYSLLTSLVVRQGRTINSQRTLIHLLYKDNVHLSASRGGRSAYGGQLAAQADVSSSDVQSNRIPSSQVPSVQSPSTQVPLDKTQSKQIPFIQVPSLQVPSVQVPSTEIPSAQVQVPQQRPQANAKTDPKSRKAEKQLPLRPPAEVTDPSDMRRVRVSI